MTAYLRNSEFFAHLPTPAESIAILFGAAEVFAFGLAGLGNPQEFSIGYGVPIDGPADAKEAPTESQKTQIALGKAIAARNLTHGALIFAFALYIKDRRALGWTVASGVVTTLSDYFIVRAYGVRTGAAIHGAAAFSSALLGWSLLHWGRNDKLW